MTPVVLLKIKFNNEIKTFFIYAEDLKLPRDFKKKKWVELTEEEKDDLVREAVDLDIEFKRINLTNLNTAWNELEQGKTIAHKKWAGEAVIKLICNKPVFIDFVKDTIEYTHKAKYDDMVMRNTGWYVVE